MNKALLVTSLAAVLGLTLWAQPGFSQNSPPNASRGQTLDDPTDAASHAVARISLLNGTATLARGDAGQFNSAILNAPLVTGDRLIAGPNSRVELQFDAANVLRLAPGAEVRMGDLSSRYYLVQIARGLVTFRILRDYGARVEISTPSSSLHPTAPGIYRVFVRADGTSEYTIRAGEGEVFSPGGSETVQAGTTLFSGRAIDNPEFQTEQMIPFDDWDRFNADRDRAFEQYPDVARYANSGPDVAGMEDLNGYGRWVYDPDYGSVWVPTVNADWAPYRDGQWEAVDYYGWSWVGYEPWGWAPYHYGRWYHGPWGWCWYPGFGSAGFGFGRPGFVGPRSAWRPALVGFVGWGTPAFGSSYAFGFGNIGWVPLGPREGFHPWYGRGLTGGASFGTSFAAASAYQNARFNAVTGVSAAAFGRSARYFRPSASDIGRASVIGVPQSALAKTYSTGSVAGSTRFFSAQNSRSQVPQPVSPRTGADGGFRRVEPSGFVSGQPVHINPPIVNLRAPGPAQPPSYGSFGGARQAQPSYPAPRYSGPPPAQQPAGGYRPSGGGGSHASGGARGGGHR